MQMQKTKTSALYKNTGKKGKVSWTTYVMVPGEDGRTRQKFKTFKTRGEAVEWGEANSVQVREGSYRELNKGTFREYVEVWKKTHLPLCKPNTQTPYLSIVNAHLNPFFGDYPMQAISSAEVNRFRTERIESGASPKTVRNCLVLAGTIFKAAIADNYLKTSPMTGVKLPRGNGNGDGDTQKSRALSPDEIQALLGVLDPEVAFLARFALLTGLRQGEEFGLQWQDIQWDENTVHVERSLCWKYGKHWARKEGEPAWILQTPKSRHAVRDVELPSGLKKDLQALWMKAGKPECGFLFCHEDGNPLRAENIYCNRFKPALKIAGIKGGVRWHDLRHTYGSMLLDQGEDLVWVSRQMGHADVSITATVYSHVIRMRRPESAGRLERTMLGK